MSPEEYRSVLLSREKDAPLDGIEEMIVALHDISEILSRPALAHVRPGSAGRPSRWPDPNAARDALWRRASSGWGPGTARWRR